jgi:hypothetical protein
MKQDTISINLSTTAIDVLKSDDLGATGPIFQTKIRAIINPAPAERYFRALDERCSHNTIAAESGKAKIE